jgi:hypothetical protein
MTAGPDEPPLDLYRIAVEERRFQVAHNWSRAQYLISLGALLLTAGVALDRPLAAVVFAVGAVESLVTRTVIGTEHGYYQAARDREKAIAEAGGYGLWGPRTTQGAGGPKRRGPKVVTWLRHLALAIAAANAIGAVVVLWPVFAD